MIELGSGSATKTRHLLSAMEEAGCLELFVPVDISEEITHETAASLVEDYPGLSVSGLVCDFEQDLELIPEAEGGRLIAFLGGTIGNLYPDARRDFLARIAALLGPDDRLLLGTDLVKDTGPARGRLQRLRRRHRRVQQERPRRPQPGARRRLRPRRVRACRPL